MVAGGDRSRPIEMSRFDSRRRSKGRIRVRAASLAVAAGIFLICAAGARGCECGDWEGVLVDGRPTSCGETVQLGIDEIQGSISIDPNYSCVGEDCDDDALTFHWEVFGPGGFYQPSAGQEMAPIEFVPPSSGTYRVRMEPSCARKGCCEPCVILVVVEEAPPSCGCLSWSDEILWIGSASGWETSVYECPQTIELPPEVCISEFLTIVPHYICDPPGPECRVSYVIDVPQWGLHEPFVDQYELTDLAQLTECDRFTDVMITAFCGEMACERCVLKLCCEQGCTCDTWQDHDGDGVFDVLVNGWVVNQIDELHVTVSDFPLQLVPGYTCQGNCLPSYECWITGGMTVGDLNGGIQLQYSHFGGAGMYGCAITPRCGSDVCDPLRFSLVIEEEPQPCKCVGWSDEIIHIGSPMGWETSVYKCPETIELPPEVCASEFLEIAPHYACDSPDPECRVSYIVDVAQWGLHEPFDDTFPLPLEAFDLERCDEYTEVIITAFCGEMACDRCVLRLCCEAGCECEEWHGVTVEDRPAVECGASIDLVPGDIQGPVTIQPHYDCVGGACPPDALTYFWEVVGPSGFYDTSGTFEHVTEIEFMPQGSGTYVVTIMPACNHVGCCDPCRVSVEI